MSNVYEGDAWKYAEDTRPNPTRSEEQANIDRLYLAGMPRAEWSRRFDELSDPSKWTREGRVYRRPETKKL